MSNPQDIAVADDQANLSTPRELDFGAVCVGGSAEATVGLQVQRGTQASSNNVFQNGATLTWRNDSLTATRSSATTPTPSAAGVASLGSPAAATLPGNWISQSEFTVGATSSHKLSYTPISSDEAVTGSAGYSAFGDRVTGSDSAAIALPVALKGKGKVCDTTPPVITHTVTGTVGNNGWYTSNVTVAFTVTDGQSEVTSKSTDCAGVTRTTDTSSVTYTCTATSGGGTAVDPVTIKRDATSPVNLSVSPDRAPTNGWYNAPVIATWSGEDVTSGIANCTAKTYSGPDTSAGSLDGACTDKAGNEATGPTFSFKYDATGPGVAGTPDRQADHNGWYNEPFTVTWSAADTGSPISCDPATTYSGPETATGSISGECTDAAGNTGSASFGFMFDDTNPTVEIAADREPNSKGWYKAPFTATTTGTDVGGSGVESCTADQTYGDDTSEEDTSTGSMSGSCTDVAGNTSGEATLGFKYDDTAPTATLTLDTVHLHNGWYNGEVKGTTTGSDNLSDVECTALQSYSGPDGSNKSMSGTCSDEAGNESLPDTKLFNYDATAPKITLSSRTPANGHGWNNSAVIVEWACADDASGSGVVAGTVWDTKNLEGRNQTASATCLDNAGNSVSDSVSDIDIDLTKPNAPTLSTDRDPEFGDWYKDRVTVTSTDNGDIGNIQSGVDKATVAGAQTFSTSGSHSATDRVEDLADNESAEASLTVKVDATNPVVTASCPKEVTLGSTATAAWAATDAHSGVAGSDNGTVSLLTGGVGSKTATVPAGVAKDNVGHDSEPATCAYSVVYGWDGFSQPINDTAHTGLFESKFKTGSTVPVKFVVKNSAGQSVQSSSTPQFQVSANRGSCDTEGTSETAPDVSASAGTAYKWADGQYVFNFSTKGKTAGEYRVWATGLDDGVNHYVDLCLTK